MKHSKTKYNANGEAFSMHLQSESQLGLDQAHAVAGRVASSGT